VSPPRHGGGGPPRRPLPPPRPLPSPRARAAPPPRRPDAARAGTRRRSRAARRRAAVLAAAAVVVALGAAALAFALGRGARPGPRTDHPARPAPVHYSVGFARCTFVDPSRSTIDYATRTSTPGRRLVTELRYPTLSGHGRGAETAGAAPAYGHGPFPTIVFAHGYGIDPVTYAALLDAWVRAGFVVVAPVFPDTSVAGLAAQHQDPNAETDVRTNQPADVAFVTDRVLGASAGEAGCPLLHGLVDPSRLALAGQSDGGETVAMLVYDRDPAYRALAHGFTYRAVAVLSGQENPLEPDDYGPATGDPALLVVQSETDTCNPPQNSVALYNAIDQPDRWFLALAHATHLPPYDGSDAAGFRVVSSVTTRFFELALGGSTPGAGFLAAGNRSPSVASLFTGPLPASVQDLNLNQRIATCYVR